MKKGIITITLLILSLSSLFSQNIIKSELINYFDNAQKLDPIEGLWSLNVVRTLYYNDDVIGKETEEVRSEWGIKRFDKLSFKVIDIGEDSKTDKGDFEAYLESSAIDGFYIYKCNFTNPNWSVKTNAELSNAFLLEYGYFVGEEYMRKSYKNDYRPGLKLHWNFIWTKKYPKLNQSNKTVTNKGDWKGNGTGFFIDINGYLSTNYHVVEDANEIEVEFVKNGVKMNFTAKVIQTDKQNDLAIIKITDESFVSFNKLPYNFNTNISDVGSNVFALGYPMALSIMGTEIKFTDGKISSKTGFKGDISTYQTTTPIQPGNSGGPLFDYDGNLIGINSAILRPDVADNVSYSIKSNYLKNLIEVLDYKISLPNDKTIATKTLTEKIKILSDYVVLIKVR